ncbi:MAG: threonine--tRNA ligase [Legionellales bacterium]|nr:threonine--tRNA ligase [Legionellales bacterium]
MPTITLPDGAQKSFDQPVTVFQVAQSIGAGLAAAALAGRVNDRLVDTSFEITEDTQLAIITEKDPEGLDIIRHSCAHLLAQAVQSVYPTAQVTIGPVIEDGFYYDFAFERAFTPEDLALFEKKMLEITKEKLSVQREVKTREEAIALFEKMGEAYKVEIIKDLPEGEVLSFYRQGDFIDLCRGPHVPNTGHIKAFKLLKVAGAYWRGDAKNAMLQRVYGTAWKNSKDLKSYINMLEEAAKRDHRKIAKDLDLFHIQNEAPGMVFWHPRGWRIYQVLQQYIRKVLEAHDYQEINTPQMVENTLWQQSGHWDKFRENMFTVDTEGRTYAVKPMNCPCHIQVFNQGLKSYRDLPLRLAEFGSCHRYEPTGALHGLMRVRNFVQDDAHIFCTENQIQSEVSSFIDLLFEVYKRLGFEKILVRLSTRPEQRVGSDEIWDKSEKALEVALDDKGLDWELLPGEGAFYGPKIEFTLKDSIGRLWQCGTIQVDFSMPERLGATYIAEDGSKQHPVMLHRAILGTFERFLGILIEEHAGNLPVWLAPDQVVVMNITDKHAPYAQKMTDKLKKLGFRAITDLRNEKIGFKIRERTLQKIPYLIVVGDKEEQSCTLSVRRRDGEDLGPMTLEALSKHLSEECNSL